MRGLAVIALLAVPARAGAQAVPQPPVPQVTLTYSGNVPPSLRVQATPPPTPARTAAGVPVPAFTYSGRVPPELLAVPGVPVPVFQFTGRLPPELAATGVPQPAFTYNGRLPGELARVIPGVPQVGLDYQVAPGGRGGVPGATPAGPTFPIRVILVEGAAHYPEAVIRAVVAPFEGRQGTIADLDAAAEAIEQRYRADGFELARALVPAQSAADGRFRLQVVEGFVGSITVETDDPDLRRLVEGRLKPVLAERPISLPTLERALLLVNDIPGISATGTLRPGQELGAADLLMSVTTNPLSAGIAINNRGSNLSGPFLVSMDASYAGLFGMGEQFSANLSQSVEFAESTNFGARWVQPLDLFGLAEEGVTLSFGANYGFGRPSGTLRSLRIKNTNISLGPRLSWPVVRSRARTITLETGFTYSESKVDVAGQPLFRDDWRTIDLRANWVEIDALGLNGVSSVSVGWTQGLPAFGARGRNDQQKSRSEADPAFGKFTAEFRHLQPLPQSLTLSLTGLFQRASRPLVPGEEFSVGGGLVGRGYDPAEIAGDNGYAGAIELRRSFRMEDGPFSELTFYGFTDYGTVSDLDQIREGRRALHSGGVGLRFTIPGGVVGGVEFAIPISRRNPTPDTARSGRVFVDLSARF